MDGATVKNPRTRRPVPPHEPGKWGEANYRSDDDLQRFLGFGHELPGRFGAEMKERHVDWTP